MTNFKDNWNQAKRRVFNFLEAMEGTSSYPFDRIDQLQRELATVKALPPSSCETCGCEQRLQP